MIIVDALVSNVIQQLVTIVQNEIQQEVQVVVGVKKDIKKLSTTLMKIQALLKDAEDRQMKENSVQLWLQELKDVAYDIDDVLDEWGTEILKSSIVEGVDDHDKKVCPANLFVSPRFCFKQFGLRHDIGHKIKDIKEKLDDIASDKEKFGFIQTTTAIRNELIIDDESRRRRRLETSSLVDVSEVFGRDMDKDIIISKLISEGSSQQDEMVSDHVPPMLISIVGMPGLGKTTLAQLTFNDERVKNHFDKRIWVHVSKPFDK
ncbi:putative disease resistance protein RGA4 [Macadamia integrifolia]|uniref:putative disease resistance protein RGA4 n=1 Tax=Macadamia integrifolia TaxID=60698 RepID=UPI001C4FCBD6|nr:putative disease resistance protein RGA4 [Macadamia integrifolia]